MLYELLYLSVDGELKPILGKFEYREFSDLFRELSSLSGGHFVRVWRQGSELETLPLDEWQAEQDMLERYESEVDWKADASSSHWGID